MSHLSAPLRVSKTMIGVEIDWDHGDADKSKKGAKEMIDGSVSPFRRAARMLRP